MVLGSICGNHFLNKESFPKCSINKYILLFPLRLFGHLSVGVPAMMVGKESLG